MDGLKLAAEFPAATREQWLDRVKGVLKGADFEKKLVSRTYDGLRIEPLYERTEPSPQPGRAAHSRWRIMQRIDHPDLAAANELALSDLAGGADALAFVYAGAATGRSFGVQAGTIDALDRILEGVMLDLIEVRIEAPLFAEKSIVLDWATLVDRRGLDPAELRTDFGLDPIGDMARSGRLPSPWPELGRQTAETARHLQEIGFRGPMLRVDTRPYHEAGASEAQELAAALATGVAYLRALEAAGDTIKTARDRLSFLLVGDADEFLTVAKFRAMRRLWGEVETACGLAPRPIHLHAETAWRMTTRRDPWVNMLRATMAVFSAGVGGADTVTALPFTAALGLPDAFARRIARNTQLILQEEASLWRVDDPAAGAGGFEALTGALSEQAWELFQAIENEGGIVASLSNGGFQARIAAVRSKRDQAIATRREPITGTSEFPDVHEAEVNVLFPAHAQGDGATGADHPDFAPLPSIRSAEAFERLRDVSDTIRAETGSRPAVFLANLGPAAAFTARATFAKNFFEAGGLEVVTNDGFQTLEALAAAFRESGVGIACLCSSDEVYSGEGEAAARAVRNAGCRRLLLAGRPGDLELALSNAGVEQFIFAGCDAITVLENLLKA